MRPAKKQNTETALVEWFKLYRPKDREQGTWASHSPDDVVTMYRNQIAPYFFGDVGDAASDVEIHAALIRLAKSLKQFQETPNATFPLDLTMFKIKPPSVFSYDYKQLLSKAYDYAPDASDSEPIRHAGELIEILRASADKAAKEYKRRGRGKRATEGLDRLMHMATRIFTTITNEQPSERNVFLHFIDALIADKIPELKRDSLQGYRRIVRNWIGAQKTTPAKSVRKSRN